MSGKRGAGAGGPGPAPDVEGLQRLLGLQAGANVYVASVRELSLRLRSLPTGQVAALVAQLGALAAEPSSYVAPHATIGDVDVDFSDARDLAACIEAAKVKGVSRWKPNLVPRRIDEKAFFGNLFSHICRLCLDLLSDEQSLEYFYNDDDDDARDARGDASASSNPDEVCIEMSDLTPSTPTEAPATATAPAPATAPAQVPPPPPPAPSPAPSPPSAPAAPAAAAQAAAPAALERFSSVALLPAGAQQSPALQAAFVRKKVLFWVGKSDNANTVVYEAGLDDGRRLSPQKPVHPYWIMYAKGPGAQPSGSEPQTPEEELNLVERNTAYGSSCVPAQLPGRFTLTLSALKERDIEVWADEATGQVHAETLINGRRDELLSVFVQTGTNWMQLPTVEHIDLRGASGTERIVKN